MGIAGVMVYQVLMVLLLILGAVLAHKQHNKKKQEQAQAGPTLNEPLLQE